MRASLDTNVIIHFYRANLQNILLDFFDDGVFIYEQIRKVELENHAKDLLNIIDSDIDAGRIELYTDEKLKEQTVYKMFKEHISENRMLYGPGDLGEVYAISLAQTIGAFFLVTNDTKQGGPYMSLLQFNDDIIPFTFADILILRYLTGEADEFQTVQDFKVINATSKLNWSFRSQVAKFVRRFWAEPYRDEEREWIQELVNRYSIKVKSRLAALSKLI